MSHTRGHTQPTGPTAVAGPPGESPPAGRSWSAPGFYPVVVAPTYNNAGTLGGIVRRVLALGLPLVVVDDGSTDGTAQVLREWETHPSVTVLRHERNRGKAAAMLTAFARAAAHGHTHAATVDTDGQLDPEEIPKLLACAAANPRALVLGYRDDTAADYPRRSRVGRRVSNALLWIESGEWVRDSQCGLRVYPLGLIAAVPHRAGRYAFETEIIARAGWARCPIAEVAVSCRYGARGTFVSHFRPWVDSFRAVGMHALLMGRGLLPWPHPKWPRERPPGPRASGWRRLLGWISPRAALRELSTDPRGRDRLAAGLAVGAFIANLPAYGLHTGLAVVAARRFRLHPLAVVLGTHLAFQPVGAMLVLAAIGVGHVLLHGRWPSLEHYDPARAGYLKVLGMAAAEWTLGGVILGLVSAWLVYGFARLALNRWPRAGADSPPPGAGSAAC